MIVESGAGDFLRRETAIAGCGVSRGPEFSSGDAVGPAFTPVDFDPCDRGLGGWSIGRTGSKFCVLPGRDFRGVAVSLGVGDGASVAFESELLVSAGEEEDSFAAASLGVRRH